MPRKYNDATSGIKVLRMFRKLMFENRKHFQTDLADYLNCSSQTVMRMSYEIESVLGANFESGLEDGKRWYSIISSKRNNLGLDFEELRYLNLCRDLSAGILPEKVINRVDDTILRLSMLMAEPENQNSRLSFFSKGKIDYTPHIETLNKLVKATEKKLICLVQYKSASRSDCREYRIAPMRIASMSNTLYILGAVVTEDMNSVRHTLSHAIHRIKNVFITDKHFNFELPEITPDMFGMPWHEPKKFEIQFKAGRAAEYVKERIWSDEQTLNETDDGGVILEIITQSEPELTAWVRSFGEEIEVFKEIKG